MVGNLKNSNELNAARTAIEQAMYYLDGTLASIKSQIDLAKSRALDGQYADPIWWRRVNSAQRFKGRQRQQLQNKFGEVNRRLRANRATANANEQLTREQAFVRIAQIHLSPETFQRLSALTRPGVTVQMLNDELEPPFSYPIAKFFVGRTDVSDYIRDRAVKRLAQTVDDE